MREKRTKKEWEEWEQNGAGRWALPHAAFARQSVTAVLRAIAFDHFDFTFLVLHTHHTHRDKQQS
jgi:hypothetical protein